MNIRRIAQGSLLGLAVAALMAASTLTVSADTVTRTTGHVGPNHLNDSMGHPGARCWYDEGGGSGEEVLTSIRVKAPVVFARDTTPARDKQKIKFKAILQGRGGGNPWTWIVTASNTAFAWDDTKAAFAPIDIHVNSQYGWKFRIKVEITYYSMSGGSWTQTGQQTHLVDWYRHVFLSTDYGNDVRTVSGFCKDYEIND